MAVTVITWLWGNKYGVDDVNRLARRVRKHAKTVERFILFTDTLTDQRLPDLDFNVEQRRIPDAYLIGQGCFCRLRMFDPGWQSELRLEDRIVSLDLDLVIVGHLDDLFDRPEPFLILRGANAVNPNPFNASVMMLRPGHRPDVWTDFSLARAGEVPFHEFPDDQGWIWHKLPDAAGWQVGQSSGIYGFEKPGWPAHGNAFLPPGAKIVAFIGNRKPWQYRGLPWMRKHWEGHIDRDLQPVEVPGEL